ncbi:HD domain-containing protein [Bacillus sp. HMF5848]|uniref:HD-GYP domain-containing protein n=1 Tax=Bacillus sp. HMF5848 TaxID=2495421 RepID=UPI000F778588|nr:HD domain-containing phosphohydrolase [Bacillus sp. HMF5848]RSK26760.1 HD domain-containing protein [Bacillus sp. HMF5848]
MGEWLDISFELVGYELMEDIYTHQGHTLLTKNTIIKEEHIIALQNHLYGEKIRVKKVTQDTKTQPPFLDIYHESLQKVKDIFTNISEDNIPPIDELTESYKPVLETLINSHISFNYLTLFKEHDSYTYTHCLNVGIISGIIGKLLGRKKEEVSMLTEAGFLHDIGKLLIPSFIIQKNEPLQYADLKILKQHPRKGHDLLIQMGETRTEILQASLLHHERLDGSGYPNGLNSERIPFHVQIISVADVYDAITTDRYYRMKESPIRAVNEIMEETLKSSLNPSITLPFCTYVMQQFMHEIVLLNDQTFGKIVFIHNDQPHKPLIMLENGSFLDMRSKAGLQIEDLYVAKAMEV